MQDLRLTGHAAPRELEGFAVAVSASSMPLISKAFASDSDFGASDGIFADHRSMERTPDETLISLCRGLCRWYRDSDRVRFRPDGGSAAQVYTVHDYLQTTAIDLDHH